MYWRDSAFHVVSMMCFMSTQCDCCVLCCLLWCCLAIWTQCIVQNPRRLLAFHFSTPTQTRKIDNRILGHGCYRWYTRYFLNPKGAGVVVCRSVEGMSAFPRSLSPKEILSVHLCVAPVSLSLLCPSLSTYPVLCRSYRKNTMATLLQLKLIRWQVLHVHLFMVADRVSRCHFTLDISVISKAFCHHSSALPSASGRSHCNIICKNWFIQRWSTRNGFNPHLQVTQDRVASPSPL